MSYRLSLHNSLIGNRKAVAKYKQLQDEIAELKKTLQMREQEVRDAHAKCDELDVPQSGSGAAFVGHRLHWYGEGKRQSFKTKENTEGYPPEEFERRIEQLDAVRTPPSAKPKPKAVSLPQLKDEDLIKQ